MDKVKAIAIMTLRRHLRSRMVWIAAGLAVLAFTMSQVLFTVAAFSGEDDIFSGSVVAQLIMQVASIFAALMVLVAAVTSATCIRSDIVDGTVFSVLSKPIARTHYIVGSVLGSAAVVIVGWMVFAVAATLIAIGNGARLGAASYAGFAGLILQGFVVVGLATLIATRFKLWPAVLLTIAINDGRNVLSTILSLAKFPDKVIDVLTFPFPNFGVVAVLVNGHDRASVDAIPVLPGIVHMADYAIVMVVLACLSFRALELNRSSE